MENKYLTKVINELLTPLMYICNSCKLIFIFLIPLLFILSCSKAPENKSDKAEILSWHIGGKVADINGTDITITLDYGSDIKAIKSDVQLSAGAKISPNPANSIDFTSSVKFKVTAENGKITKEYKVIVKIAKNDKAEILSWKAGGEVAVAKINGTDITITLAYEPDKKAIKSDVQLSPGAKISPDPANSIDYTSAKTFTVTAEDGTSKDYKVTVNLEDPIYSWTAGWRDDDAYTAKIDQSTGKIEIDLNSADFDTKVNLSTGVTISPDPNSLTDWTNEKTFTTTKGSKTKTYKVKVKVDGKDIIKATDANIQTTINTEIGKYGDNANYNYIDVSSVTNMDSLFKQKCEFNGDISKWNVSKVTNMLGMFESYNCDYKFNNDIGSWDVSSVTNMQNMFKEAEAFNQDIGGWDVSKVIDMKGIFRLAKVFNQNIGGWDVSSVNTMEEMFYKAEVFNQNIGRWDVSNVTNMKNMFNEAKAFNQDISGWTVSNVIDMQGMFVKAEAFDQDIGGWDVSNVTNMKSMFESASVFNKSLSSWKVNSVTNMSAMFKSAEKFNQDIGGWIVSNVTNMTDMFHGAKAFDQNIGGWIVSNVEKMSAMFQSAEKFNQDLSNWTVSSVTDMSTMFHKAEVFDQDIGKWKVDNVTNMGYMFSGAKNFNQNIGRWIVSNVTNMTGMFKGAEKFNQDLSGWKSPKTDKVTDCKDFSKDATAWVKAKPTFKNCP